MSKSAHRCRCRTHQVEAAMLRQSEPIRPVMSPTTTPSRDRTWPRTARDASATVVVLWQHCVWAVEQSLAGMLRAVGVATARVASAAAIKANLNCIMMSSWELMKVSSWFFEWRISDKLEELLYFADCIASDFSVLAGWLLTTMYDVIMQV